MRFVIELSFNGKPRKRASEETWSLFFPLTTSTTLDSDRCLPSKVVELREGRGLRTFFVCVSISLAVSNIYQKQGLVLFLLRHGRYRDNLPKERLYALV